MLQKIISTIYKWTHVVDYNVTFVLFPVELFHLNFQSFEALSCYHDRQFQVTKNYSDLKNIRFKTFFFFRNLLHTCE